MRKKSVHIPKSILWDYKKAPADLLWKLQRIADFFPRFGRNREVVLLLYKNLNKLKVDLPTSLLIREYYKKWKTKKS